MKLINGQMDGQMGDRWYIDYLAYFCHHYIRYTIYPMVVSNLPTKCTQPAITCMKSYLMQRQKLKRCGLLMYGYGIHVHKWRVQLMIMCY